MEMKRFLCGAMALGLFVCSGAHAVSFSKTTGGPRSAGIEKVIETSSGALIAATGSGLQRSIDGGARWKPLKGPIAQLAQSPAAGGGKVYVLSSGSKLYQSDDDGITWRGFGTGLKNFSLQSVTADNQFVYVTAAFFSPDFVVKVYRSPHDAAAFVERTPTAAGVRSVLALDDRLLAIVPNSGIRYSTTHGDSWSTSAGVAGDWQYLVAGQGGIVIYATNRGAPVARSSDGGQSFTIGAGSGLPGQCNINTTAAGVDASGSLYRAIQSNVDCTAPMIHRGIFRSDDAGGSFVADNGGDFAVLSKRNVAVSSFARAGDGFFAGTSGAGLFADTGSGWKRSDLGIRAAGVGALAARGGIGKLIAGIGGGGVMITDDGGAHWIPRNTGIADRNIVAVLVDGSTLLAAAGGYLTANIYRSVDDGLHWVVSSSGIARADFGGDVALAKGPGGLYALTGRKVWLSVDGGASWSNASGDLPASFSGRALAASASAVVVYLAGSDANAGVWRSLDHGAHWTHASEGMTGAFYGSVFSATGELIASAGAMVYRSVDNGDHWTPTTGFAVSQYGIQTFSLAQDGNGALYLGDEHAGLSVSTDGGATWTPDSDGLFPSGACVQRILSLAFDGARIYAGQGGAGVSVSEVSGVDAEGDGVACTTATP
jgi:hypothetical protein